MGAAMGRSSGKSYLWVYYTSAALLFAGAVVRAPLVIEDDDVLLQALVLLAVWMVLFVSEIFLSRRWRPWSAIYLILQAAVVVALLSLPGSHDFFAVLFGVLSMYAMQRYGLPLGAVWVALFVPLTLVPLLDADDMAEVISLVLVYTAVDVFLGAYALATRGAVEARGRNQALAVDLREANSRLEDYSRRLERLAVARERNRLGRELHDSVTQTIYSMTLTSQSATLLLEREPGRVEAQLERLAELTQRALTEMHVLISELAPDAPVEGGLVAAIKRDIERRAMDGLTVSLEVEEPPRIGVDGPVLSMVEEQGLLGITQEALNNVVKHSGVSEATIHLRLRDPASVEIVDRGRGFEMREAADGPGMGLGSMSERATETGWRLQVLSSLGSGTRVLVERVPLEGGDG